MGEQLKIGENLKNIRKSMGLSLDAVSSMTGVSKTMPVSYTHLDVYKRQVIYGVKCFLEKAIHIIQFF